MARRPDSSGAMRCFLAMLLCHCARGAAWTGSFAPLPTTNIPHPTLLGIGFVKSATTDLADIVLQTFDGCGASASAAST